jgi:uncharacterized repeat protein (TIGR03803 family)
VTGYGGPNGYGTVFKMTASGSTTTLYSFSYSDGQYPYGKLVQGTDGDFYGTTWQGGTYGYGTVFKITTSGSLTTLYSFDYSHGRYAWAGLVQGTDGDFYGTTYEGGTYDYGTVFRITASGSLTTLHSFYYSSDGAYPYAALIQGTDGDFYGTTYYGGSSGQYGTVFKITSSGSFTNLHTFTNYSDGGYVYSGLVQGTDGNFYGTTYQGGTYGYGTVFKMTPDGTLTSLHSFDYYYYYNNTGAYPWAGLVEGKDGHFYGVTEQGGARGYGTVFRITSYGALTTLYSFNYYGYGTSGAHPRGVLVQGKDGDFYGTTYSGGSSGNGTVFRVGLSSIIALNEDDATGIDGAKFECFGLPIINSNGHVAFLAEVSGTGVTNACNSGIWADDGTGARQLVVRTGSAAPGTSGAVFSRLNDPVYNNIEAVAFTARLRSGDTNGPNDRGIWSNDGGSLQLIARENDPAPGCPKGVIFSAFQQIAIPDQGGVVFHAKVEGSGVTRWNRFGIWSKRSDGELRLVLRQGDKHPETDKVIKSLVVLKPDISTVGGQSRSVAQATGELAYFAAFDDGSAGIFKMILP